MKKFYTLVNLLIVFIVAEIYHKHSGVYNDNILLEN